jgi:hypothetical protein
MGDRELSTRDLAERSDTTASDGPVETEQETSDQDDIREPSRSGGSPGETEPADEPVTRGLSESDDPGEDVLAERGTDSAQAQPSPAQPSPPDSPGGERGPLLPDDQTERFTRRWEEIQASFVDEPRDSVSQADALVADLMQRLAAGFSAERERLEGQWDSGDDVSTEDLRVALTRYRSFFDRLLSA